MVDVVVGIVVGLERIGASSSQPIPDYEGGVALEEIGGGFRVLPDLIVGVSQKVVGVVFRSKSNMITNSENWIWLWSWSVNVLNCPFRVFIEETRAIIGMEFCSGVLVSDILAILII